VALPQQTEGEDMSSIRKRRRAGIRQWVNENHKRVRAGRLVTHHRCNEEIRIRRDKYAITKGLFE